MWPHFETWCVRDVLGGVELELERARGDTIAVGGDGGSGGGSVRAGTSFSQPESCPATPPPPLA